MSQKAREPVKSQPDRNANSDPEEPCISSDSLPSVVQLKPDPGPGLTSLKETSVLAESYVPEWLRALNRQPVTTPFFAEPPANLELQLKEISRSAVPQHFCVCKEKHGVFTHVNIQVPELRFALLGPLPATPSPVPHTNNISNLDDYVRTFTTLLDLERREVLLQYERYSQYRMKLDFQFGAPASYWTIPGIADVKPSVQPGDICLMRPMIPLSLPTTPYVPPAHRNPHPPPTFSPHVHQVEIVAEIIQVQRSKYGLKDKVVTTWLNPGLQTSLHFAYPNHLYNLRFVPSVKTYSRCRTALEWCASLPPDLAMNFLFPNQAPLLPTGEVVSLHENNLNQAQNQFVNMVVKRSLHPADRIRPPMILTGPAGTGKTKALLQAIAKVLTLDKTRILVCTPSHTAANVITQRLALLKLDRNELFRLLDSDRPVETIPSDILRFCKQDDASGHFTLPINLIQFRVIVCTCSDSHLLYQAGLTNAQLRDRRQCFSTWISQFLSSVNMSATIGGVTDPHFTHLFIDEASQATEPETLIPLSVVVDTESIRPAEIALVGDPRQLSPQVYSTEAHNHGLGIPWMERLLQRPCQALGGGHEHLLGPNLTSMTDFLQHSFQTSLSTFLTMNYRGHPSFLMMPSALFYFDKLQCNKGLDWINHSEGRNTDFDWQNKLRIVIEGLSNQVTISATIETNLPSVFRSAKKQDAWPIHFRGVRGRDASATIQAFCGTDSWCNREEADVVVEIAMALTQNGVSTKSIGIMAPFRGQVVLLRQMLREQNMGGINVGTIEDYQSVERRVIILSLTRSNERFVTRDVDRRLGVFRQAKLTNVALTRAEDIFIVVGNPSTMVNDPLWRQWLWFCLRNGFWYGEGQDVVADYFSHHSECRVVRYLPTSDENSSRGFVVENRLQEEKKKDEDDAVIVLSTLEELCLNC